MSRPGESDVVGYKGRIVWREAGRARLEFKAFGQAVHLHEPGLDERSAAALLALVRSFDDWLNAWDREKR